MGRPYANAAVITLIALAASGARAQSFEALGPTGGQLVIQTPDTLRVSGNVAVFDATDDGQLDLLWTAADGLGLQVDRNIGVPTSPQFVDHTEASGLTSGGVAVRAFGLGDFDGDGITDVYLCLAGEDRLFFGQSGGGFYEVTRSHLEGDAGLSAAAAVADFDGDGDLDIYVGRYVGVIGFPFHQGHKNLLLVNDGRGHFTDRAGDWGLDDDGAALAAAWSDADEDGDLDLLLVNDFGPHKRPHRAYRNDGPSSDGGWQLADVSTEWGFDRGLYGMGVGVIDADRDGHLDYYLTSIGRHVLLTGPASPRLVERTDELGVASTFGINAHGSSWGAVVLDADGDGYDDLYVRAGTIAAAQAIATSSLQVDRLWSLSADGTLVDRWPELFPPDVSRFGRGVVAADVDGDGRVDVVGGAANDATRIYLGGGDPDPVHVTLAPTISAPGAPGAQLWVSCGGERRLNLRQAYAGGSLGSAPPPGHEWLPIPGDCGTDAVVHVAWPTGAHSSLAVEPGGFALIGEPVWIGLEPASLPVGTAAVASLSVNPRGADGQSLGPGHDVVVTRDDEGLPQALDDLGDGWYEADLDAPSLAGPVRLTIAVDGERLPVTRWLTGTSEDSATMRLYPSRLIAGATSTVTVSLGRDAAPGIEANGIPLADVEILGPGIGQAAFAVAVGETTVSLQATADGDSVGPSRVFAVHPRVDIDRSYWEMYEPFVEIGGPAQTPIVNFYPADKNGLGSLLTSDDVRLLEGAEPVPFTFRVIARGRYRIIPDRPLAAESQVVVEAAGVAFPALPIRSWSEEADLIEIVSSEHTEMGSYFEGCRADGSDVLLVSVLPRTPEGQPLPEMPSIGLDVEGGEVIGEPSFNPLGLYNIVVRCGTEVGQGRIALRLGGAAAGVETTFQRFEPIAVVPDPAGTELRVPAMPLGPGVPADLDVLVRDAAGELAGSGLEVALFIDGLDEWVDVPYCGTGVYCVEVAAPPGGAVWTAHVYVEGVDTGESAVLWFSAPEVEPEPEAADGGLGDLDVGPDLDLGVDADDDDLAGDVPIDLGVDSVADVPGPDDAGVPDGSEDADSSDTDAVEVSLVDEAETSDDGEVDMSAETAASDSGCGCGVMGGSKSSRWPLWPAIAMWVGRPKPRGWPSQLGQHLKRQH